jgi:glycosyltransferase involved in cell wall biosynthesis
MTARVTPFKWMFSGQDTCRKAENNKIVRVLFDHRIFLMQSHGGVSRYFIELIRELAKLPDVKPLVFAGLHASRILVQQKHTLGARVVGFRLPFGVGHSPILSLFNSVLFSLHIRKTQPDAYHATYYHHFDTKYRPPLIITVHDMIAEIFGGALGPRDPTIGRKRLCAEAASKIICVSESTRRDFSKIYPDLAGKATVVHHGSAFHGEPSSERPLEEPYLLYVGQRCCRKNNDLLRSVMPRLQSPRPKLVYFGGQPASRRELMDAPVTNAIYVSGDSDDDLATWYRHASMLVYPSLYEGFGMPPLEAMQAGCPVVCSNTSSLPEVVGDAGFLLDPADVALWATSIDHIRSDRLLRESLVGKGKERARQFSWRACAQSCAQIYASAVREINRVAHPL